MNEIALCKAMCDVTDDNIIRYSMKMRGFWSKVVAYFEKDMGEDIQGYDAIIMKWKFHGIVHRLYYCPMKTPLNVGIRELKTDNYVDEFLRAGYEPKWFIDLYVEHIDYDVLDFINEEANGVISSGSSDEYYSCNEFPQIEGDALKDPDDANINPSCKEKKVLHIQNMTPTVPWNQMIHVLGMRSLLVYCGRSVEGGSCASKYNNEKDEDSLFFDYDAESPRPAKSAKTDASTSKYVLSLQRLMQSTRFSLYPFSPFVVYSKGFTSGRVSKQITFIRFPIKFAQGI
ncbi:hypothetical protein Tco_0935969 [Tanacetum coccineum]